MTDSDLLFLQIFFHRFYYTTVKSIVVYSCSQILLFGRGKTKVMKNKRMESPLIRKLQNVLVKTDVQVLKFTRV